MANIETLLLELKALSKPEGLQRMQKFGVNTEKALGVNIPSLRNLAKKYKKNHSLALELWASEYHEARILAALVDDFTKVDPQQMDDWVQDFNSWDLCDQCCGNLFDKTPYAFEKACQWTQHEKEFTKRAGFVMMAELAVHDKQASNDRFESFFPLIVREAKDERNFVKKAVNWALRQIGKRNMELNQKAISIAREIKLQQFKSSKWIAADALRELTSEKILKSLK